MYPTLNILTVDDHPLYVQGMQTCMQKMPVAATVSSCSTLAEVHGQLRHQPPQLVFLELNLHSSRYDGFTICREITSNYKNIFVAILSRYNSKHMIDKARECGARAYFDKSNPPEVFCTFLHEFVSGTLEDFPIHVNERPRLHQGFEADAFELKQMLTKREVELMQLIINGKEHTEIEELMDISYQTYKYHHHNLLGKLEVKNDVLLTRFAIEHNFTDEDFRVTYTPNPLMRKTA